jgi:hypothetical protein
MQLALMKRWMRCPSSQVMATLAVQQVEQPLLQATGISLLQDEKAEKIASSIASRIEPPSLIVYMNTVCRRPGK